jgi:hypothetical protein
MPNLRKTDKRYSHRKVSRMFKLLPTILSSSIILISCFPLADGGVNTVVKEGANPDKTLKAVIFLKEGGATVSNSYQVSILPAETKLSNNEVGNTFTVDENHGATWLRDSSINITWKTNDTVLIDYDKELRTFIQQTKVGNVTVIYQPK